MKKILFVMAMIMMATTAIMAQDAPAQTTEGGNNATLLQPAGDYIYYGNQVMNKKECVKFLATRNQEAYKTFKSGYQCYNAGWWTLGAGLGIDLAGSILLAFSPEKNSPTMLYSGITCIGLGAAAIIASIPTIFIGYVRLNKGINMFNKSQAAAVPQAYWTIQGSQDGLGLALHF
ncbi:MAG: hypothetical protein IJY67_03155 [Paludibacteraceae bacterium]|nr:hypothetical protein [Paludibacteraceae bacterium]